MDILMEWLTMLLRWWHVLAGITWVGTSFYFNWFDAVLRPVQADDVPPKHENNRGIMHEVHGGNFYYHEQYFPDALPSKLHVHAWPSKITFMTGLLLLVLIYWLQASAYMIDRRVADLQPWQAILISAGSILACWLFYDTLCRKVASNRSVFWGMAVLTVVAAWGFQHVFGGRAAYISVGVMLGSMMGLNVWRVIAPKSIHMQQQLRSGGGYNREDGFAAKRRSQHNNYFTLPVVLTMISNHFPTAFNHSHAWLILVLLMLAGVTLRHALNLRYKYACTHYPLFGVVGLSVLTAIGISLYRPMSSVSGATSPVAESQASLSAADQRARNTQQLMGLVQKHCQNCHSATPSQPGFAAAPQGLALDKLEQVLAAADKIHLRVWVARDMPLGNMTQMRDDERATLHSLLQQLQEKTEQ